MLSNNPFKKTIETSIVRRKFAFPTLECLDFHTENASTFTQHVLQKKYTFLHFLPLVSIVLTRTIT